MFNISGRSIREKLTTITKYYQDIDVFFVHRDADGEGAESREMEISQAAEGLIPREKIIPVIPVTMLETWLLADHKAICRIAGSPQLSNINCIPKIKNLEKAKDTKELLMQAFCDASGETGGRLKKLKKRFGEMRARLTFELDPDGPVNDLESYSKFRGNIKELFERMSENKL